MLKNILITTVLISSLLLGTTSESKAQGVTVSFSTFQNELSPYGQWRHMPRYGQVWTYQDPSFSPYRTNGYWEYTNYGWAWVSDFDWGWAPFHYGRWEHEPGYGWFWIPGYEWAPAWVGWSEYNGYYGWAPLGYGMNSNIAFNSIPYDRWTFIPRNNICDRDPYSYYQRQGRYHNFRNATVINNYYYGNDGRYYCGPRRQDAQRYYSKPIEERQIVYRQKELRRNAQGNLTLKNNTAPANNTAPVNTTTTLPLTNGNQQEPVKTPTMVNPVTQPAVTADDVNTVPATLPQKRWGQDRKPVQTDAEPVNQPVKQAPVQPETNFPVRQPRTQRQEQPNPANDNPLPVIRKREQATPPVYTPRENTPVRQAPQQPQRVEQQRPQQPLPRMERPQQQPVQRPEMRQVVPQNNSKPLPSKMRED